MFFDLVIQGDTFSNTHAQAVAALVDHPAMYALDTQGVRFSPVHAAAEQRTAVAAYCQQHALDFAFLPVGRRLADYGLLVTDMDSTLITIECIDELADMCGLKPQVAAITARSMRGEIDFSTSLRERVALLAGLDESALERVYQERLQLMRGAKELLAACQAQGVKTLLISGGFTYFTDRLKAELGLDYAIANQLEIIDGKLTGRIQGAIVDAQAKADWLIKLRGELGLSDDATIAIGDGANDLKMIAVAGLGIATHAKPKVQAEAPYALNYVGLEGIVRMLS